MRICVSVVIGNLIACLFPIPGLAQPWLDASVRVTNRNGRIITAGSGTVIGSNGEVGLVVTVKHLFRDGVGEIIVRRRDGHGYLGKIWAVDECADLAAIVIQDTGDLPQVQISSGQPKHAVFAGLELDSVSSQGVSCNPLLQGTRFTRSCQRREIREAGFSLQMVVWLGLFGARMARAVLP